MNGAIVIFKKEMLDQLRSYKIFILSIILIIFAISSPVLAKLTPDMLKMFGDQIKIEMPTPTYIDAYAQFFKNLSQIGAIVILLIFSGIVCDEKIKGSATMILTKNLSRTSFVVGKFLAAAFIWTAIYLVSVVICIGYAYYFFPVWPNGDVLLSFVCFWLYGLLLISFTLFASAVSNSHATATVFAFLGWVVLLISSAIPKVKDYSPSLLGALNVSIVSGDKNFSDVYISMIIGCVLIIGFVILSARSLSKQEI
jgi:ABC-2 type transport system permease protein